MQAIPNRISLIAAIAENCVIGRGNKLPWHLPADLKHFKQLTMGKPMIMGRRTWQSLPGLLPGRVHIVISRDHGFTAAGCEIARSFDEALRKAGPAPEVMVIGGGALYKQVLPYASRMYLTLVRAEIDGDILFPRFDKADWIELEREEHLADARNVYDYVFLTLERVRQ
ncbi:MAG: dihydrofolate reductase [Gammaproteobacteria bacterium]|nr:dihydrofolate reductase [Gammaproteobacteria bacterium]